MLQGRSLTRGTAPISQSKRDSTKGCLLLQNC